MKFSGNYSALLLTLASLCGSSASQAHVQNLQRRGAGISRPTSQFDPAHDVSLVMMDDRIPEYLVNAFGYLNARKIYQMAHYGSVEYADFKGGKNDEEAKINALTSLCSEEAVTEGTTIVFLAKREFSNGSDFFGTVLTAFACLHNPLLALGIGLGVSADKSMHQQRQHGHKIGKCNIRYHVNLEHDEYFGQCLKYGSVVFSEKQRGSSPKRLMSAYRFHDVQRIDFGDYVTPSSTEVVSLLTSRSKAIKHLKLIISTSILNDFEKLIEFFKSQRNHIESLSLVLYRDKMNDEHVNSLATALSDDNFHLKELEITHIGPSESEATGELYSRRLLEAVANKIESFKTTFWTGKAARGVFQIAASSSIHSLTVSADSYERKEKEETKWALKEALTSETNQIVELELIGEAAISYDILAEILRHPHNKIKRLIIGSTFTHVGADEYGFGQFMNAFSHQNCKLEYVMVTKGQYDGMYSPQLRTFQIQSKENFHTEINYVI